jgi:RimJ/RimL family protein N-acetyltransferase
VLEAAFLGLGYDILGAGHYVDNPASGRVLTKLGFEPTGEILPYPCLARGCEVDSVEYAMTRTRWLERHGAYREAA